jgi:gag-polypeptide of LTR copia-type
MIRESKLGRNEDPEIWINNLEDLQVKLEVMGSNMTDEQFLIQVLNSLSGDYKLQMTLMEKCIGNKENPLSTDELKEDLNLRYERFSSKSESTRNDDYGEEKALFVTQFRGKCQSCRKLGHKLAQCKSKMVQEDKEINCNYCKKSGHLKSQCFKLLRKNQNQAEGNQDGTRNGIAGSAGDVVLTTMTANDGIDSKIWIGDSGSSCHYCNSEEGLYNYTTISEEITVGNSNKMLAKKVGSLRCMVQQKNGEKFVVVLKCVKFVPELWENLFSIGKALKNGFNLGNEDAVMKLVKENITVYFDRILNTKNGFVSGTKLLPILGNNIATTAVKASKVKPKMNINNLHKIVGHCDKVATRMTGKLWI